MLRLRAGDASVVLAPEIGGSILGWTLGGQTILRRARADAIMSSDARGMACFPLVPPWEVDEAGPASARLSLIQGGEAAARWPFRATQAFDLDEDALRVTLEIENLGPRPAPAGLGLQACFPAGHRAASDLQAAKAPVLHFAADAVWTDAGEGLAAARIAMPAAWDHHAGRAVGSVALDNCFADWRGRADIAWARPGPLLSIEATALFGHLGVFAPAGADFFCLAPASHRIDALNRLEIADHGMHILEPGQCLQGEIRFRVLD